jgi:hypothetical protein
MIDHAREDILRPTDQFDHGFVDWFRKVVEDPIINEDNGLWKDFKANYRNMLDHHFYPALVNNEFDKGCGNGKITCADHTDIYIQPTGVLNSAMVELQTYHRNLEKILAKLGAKNDIAAMTEFRRQQEKVFGALETLRSKDGIQDFNFEVLQKDMEAFKNAFPPVVMGLLQDRDQASKGAAGVMASGTDETTQKAIFAVSGRIFELMSNVLAELESYRGYLETLELNKTSATSGGTNKAGANTINPMVRF